jgi:hypothetical protein
MYRIEKAARKFQNQLKKEFPELKIESLADVLKNILPEEAVRKLQGRELILECDGWSGSVGPTTPKKGKEEADYTIMLDGKRAGLFSLFFKKRDWEYIPTKIEYYFTINRKEYNHFSSLEELP